MARSSFGSHTGAMDGFMRGGDAKRRRWETSRERMLPVLIGGFIVVNLLARILIEAPLIRVTELGLCREYYLEVNASQIGPDGFLPEELCKVNEVQQPLNTMRGMFAAIASVFGLLAAVPYFHLGQTWDRRTLVLFECIAWLGGIIYTYTICYFWNIFPLRAIYGATIFTLLGGHVTTAAAFLNAILAESVPAASMSKLLFYINASILFSKVVGFGLAGWMMEVSLGLSIGLGFIVYLASLPLLYLTPEPRNSATTPRFIPLTATGTADDPDNDDDDDEHKMVELTVRDAFMHDEDPLSATNPLFSRVYHSPLDRVRSIVRANIAHVRAFVRQSPAAAACIAITFVAKLGTEAQSFMTQWSSRVFALSLARMNYVVGFGELVGGLTLCALPTLTAWLARRARSATAADRMVALASAVVASAGMLLVAIAPGRPFYYAGLAVLRLGTGFSDALTAYGSARTRPESLTTFYIGGSVAQTIATIIGDPSWSWAVNEGFEKGEGYDRGPFVLSALIGAAAAACVWYLKK